MFFENIYKCVQTYSNVVRKSQFYVLLHTLWDDDDTPVLFTHTQKCMSVIFPVVIYNRLYFNLMVLGTKLETSRNHQKCVCTFTIITKQPKFSVTDIVGTGALKAFGKSRLWHFLRINKCVNTFTLSIIS